MLIEIPDVIQSALASGAALSVSISGGKDGQAMTNLLAQHPKRSTWTGAMLALHADLGRAEWKQTREVVEHIANFAGIPIEIVRRPKGDLFQRIEQEHDRKVGTGEMFWPTSTMRYCTAELKRDQLVKRQRRLGQVVVSAQGMRAEESPGRRRRPSISIEGKGTAKRLKTMSPAEALLERTGDERLILNWLPIQPLTLDEVWVACGTTSADLERRRAIMRCALAERREDLVAEALHGWPAHPAYVLGATRLSCALCILASAGDLEIGARFNPQPLAFLAELEHRSGMMFQRGTSLVALQARIATSPTWIPNEFI